MKPGIRKRSAIGSSSSSTSSPLRRALDFSTSVTPSPYAVPAMEHLKNSMIFRVRVPVLSERMVSIMPSSSLMFEVRARGATSPS